MNRDNGIIYIPRTYINNYWHDMLWVLVNVELGIWVKLGY